MGLLVLLLVLFPLRGVDHKMSSIISWLWNVSSALACVDGFSESFVVDSISSWL